MARQHIERRRGLRVKWMFHDEQQDCGLADGDTLTFYFTQKQSQYGKYERPFVEISIKVGLRTPSHSVLR